MLLAAWLTAGVCFDELIEGLLRPDELVRTLLSGACTRM